MALSVKYIHVPLLVRTTMMEDALATLRAILRAHQGGTHSGNSFQRAQLKEVLELIADLGGTAAVLGEVADGTAALQRFTHADMSHGP